MLAATASRSSSSGSWRRSGEAKAEERPTSGSWRDRRSSNGSQGAKDVGGGEERRLSGDWRDRKTEAQEATDLAEVYGTCMPDDDKLSRLYEQLKNDNNKLTTWLVESVYPSLDSLPNYITLSTKTSRLHDKYEIRVNSMTNLARQARNVPASTITLLDSIIAARSEHTYWMSQKSAANLARKDDHTHYIGVLKEMKPILASRMEPTASPAPAKTTGSSSTPIQTPKLVLGKRRASPSPTRQSSTSNKAAKINPPTPTEVRATEPAPKQQDDLWRAAGYDNTSGRKCALVAAKGMSYAAAARVAVA